MEILSLLRSGQENAIKRHTISMLTGMPDYAIRLEIERLKKDNDILYDDESEGYYLDDGGKNDDERQV